MRYENPFYMAEDAGAADVIAGGRLQLGISRGLERADAFPSAGSGGISKRVLDPDRAIGRPVGHILADHD